MSLEEVFTDSFMLVYFECLTAPYTVISGHGGCGRDDVYTACSNDVAYGSDGKMIKWYVSNNSSIDAM